MLLLEPPENYHDDLEVVWHTDDENDSMEDIV
jgi:hypothetical protein